MGKLIILMKMSDRNCQKTERINPAPIINNVLGDKKAEKHGNIILITHINGLDAANAWSASISGLFRGPVRRDGY